MQSWLGRIFTSNKDRIGNCCHLVFCEDFWKLVRILPQPVRNLRGIPTNNTIKHRKEQNRKLLTLLRNKTTCQTLAERHWNWQGCIKLFYNVHVRFQFMSWTWDLVLVIYIKYQWHKFLTVEEDDFFKC